jgi:dodecin
MGEHTYGIKEVVGTSHDSVHQAIRNGVADAAKTIDRLDWFEVVEVRGHVEDGEVGHFQVTMKVGFRLPDGA